MAGAFLLIRKQQLRVVPSSALLEDGTALILYNDYFKSLLHDTTIIVDDDTHGCFGHRR